MLDRGKYFSKHVLESLMTSNYTIKLKGKRRGLLLYSQSVYVCAHMYVCACWHVLWEHVCVVAGG